MQFKHVSMNAGNFTEQQVLEALTVIAESPKPVLVHCLHGSDRTGTIVAMYRMVCQGWNKQQSLRRINDWRLWLPSLCFAQYSRIH